MSVSYGQRHKYNNLVFSIRLWGVAVDNFYLEFLRSQENPAGFYAPLHHHSCYELVYYISGNGTFSIDGKEYSYHSNTFSILPPRVMHDEHTLNTSELLFIGFRYHDVEMYLKPGVYEDTHDQYVYRILLKFEKELKERKPLYPSMLNAYTQELVVWLIRNYFHSELSDSGNSIEYIQRYIDEHCTDTISHTELSKMSGYSYDWFRHLFKEKTGYSLSQYIILQRLKIAAGLLKTTEQSVTQISEETNFTSTSQFIAFFKRQYQLTPHKYRKKYQNMDHVGLSNTAENDLTD